jgi:hypothetical protein
LHFLPLTDITRVDSQRQQLLRQNPRGLDPREALYLGFVGPFGEVFVSMSDPVVVPAGYFDLTMLQAGVLPSGEPDLRLTPQAQDTRIGRPSDEIMDLFRAKWIAHWTGQKPRGF